MSSQIRVLLLIPRWNAGGAARVSGNLARGLSQCGYEVHLAVVTGHPAGEICGAGFATHWLGCSRVRYSGPRLINLIRKLRPHVILSNVAHLNQLVLALRPALPRGIQIVVRNDGGVRPERLSSLHRRAFRSLHNTADALICQSEQMKAELASELGRSDRLLVLPNPVEIQSVPPISRTESPWRGTGPNLIAIGRLVTQKGFDLLLHAFGDVSTQFPGAQLAILGDGPERNTLTALAHELGIASRVHFPGEVPHPRAWFPQASAFILSSREDAMPNALLEAAAAGLPIVATPARGGVPDLLRHQPGAWLAAEVSAYALAATMHESLSALAPEQRFHHAWLEPFAWNNAIARYDDLIRSLASAAQ